MAIACKTKDGLEDTGWRGCKRGEEHDYNRVSIGC